MTARSRLHRLFCNRKFVNEIIKSIVCVRAFSTNRSSFILPSSILPNSKFTEQDAGTVRWSLTIHASVYERSMPLLRMPPLTWTSGSPYIALGTINIKTQMSPRRNDHEGSVGIEAGLVPNRIAFFTYLQGRTGYVRFMKVILTE